MTDTTMAPGPRNDGSGRSRRWRLLGWGGAGLLLILPLIAMQFSNEVAWSRMDFLVFAAMLATVGAAFELAVRLSRNALYRAAAGIALIAAFLLAWINAAVGLIGAESNPANLLYAGVLGIGVLGSIIVRGRASGMAVSLAVVAVAQAAVAAVAIIGGLGEPYNGPLQLAVLNGFFVGLWLVSAWLFARSAPRADDA